MRSSVAYAESPDHTRAVIEAACAKIAPAWPLDRMIAVNPYWGWRDRPVREVAARLGALAGAPFLMPRSWYRARRSSDVIPNSAIERAIARMGHSGSQQEVLHALGTEPTTLPRHPVISEIRDALRDPQREATWHEYLLHQVGQTCAAFFDRDQAVWQPSRGEGLYAFWRTLASADATPQLLLGDRRVRHAISELPEDPTALVAEALDTLALPRDAQEAYLTALLLRIGGWASHAAFRRWEAGLQGGSDDSIEQLLAIQLAWELVLYRTAEGTDVPLRWTRARREWQEEATTVAESQAADWVLQRAFESRYQDRLALAISWNPSVRAAVAGSRAVGTVSAQAVFCIDVRSEVYRRHLEEVDPGVRTLGFAGFFGVPLAYEALSGVRRPQLPGLLGASLIARDDEVDLDGAREEAALHASAAGQWKSVFTAAPTTFAMVETTGLATALKVATAAFEPLRAAGDPLRAGRDDPSARIAPVLASTTDGASITAEARVALALSILRGMSLVNGFAPLVAFVGHGARVANNPQAAALACGACGGQSGEVNARVVAGLLNDPAVRTGLAAAGVEIPETTRFIAGVHDTVTDDLVLYADRETEVSHAQELASLRATFARTATRVRSERAQRLGELPTDDRELAEALRHRAADWSEVRPEWALARNAAFVVAPRSRTRPLDLKGRAFLHEYDCRLDLDGSVLESILTAPMVVAHWINFQYWASTVDPMHYGSGDKTRHNVVGGSLGVVEGAGGDLRIGLAQQSVHDGTDFVHEPMRLAVYVEAEAAVIDAIIARQPTVRQLIEGEWVFLYRIDPLDGAPALRRTNGWEEVVLG